MRTSLIFSQIIVVCLLFSCCAVDPRWGPRKTGLRENMSWQYTSIQAAAVSPVSMTRSEPVIPIRSSGKRKVHLIGSTAIAPSNAPDVVKRAVAAGN